MGVEKVLHINDGIPDELMRLFFCNHIGHKLFNPQCCYSDRKAKYEKIKEKYGLDELDAYTYFHYTPSYSLGYKYSDGKKWHFGHIINSYDRDGYGAFISDTLVKKMYDEAERVFDVKEATLIKEFLERYKGRKVFLINW